MCWVVCTHFHITKQIRKEKPNQVIVAESGYSKKEELDPLKKENINAVLIGEGLAKYPMLLESFNEN